MSIYFYKVNHLFVLYINFGVNMDVDIESKLYQLKLSELRNQVAKELVIVSGLLKDTTERIKNHLEMPGSIQKEEINQIILQAGKNLNNLNSKIFVLNNRIKHITKNHVVNRKTKELDQLKEMEAIKTLTEDISKNTKSISILNKHYLEIVGLYTNDTQKNQELTDFDCFRIRQDDLFSEKSRDQIIVVDQPKSKVKKQGCFGF